MAPREEWKEIAEAPGYFVSNLGRVRGKSGKILSNKKVNSGYPSVTLCVNGRKIERRTHALVLTTFKGECPPSQEARHLSGVSANNYLSNLEWGTKLENAADKKQHGTMAAGEQNGQAKLTQEQIEQIRKEYIRYSRKYGSEALGKKYNVDRSTIGYIVNRKTWR